jgi:hypothetical protein
MEQQQPQTISLADIANRTFGETQETPAIADVILPEPPAPADVTPPAIKDVVETPEVVKPEAVVTSYSKQIKSFIEAGFLDDVSITFDDQEAFLSEIDIKDEETYKTILSSIKEEKDKLRNEKYISKEGLDENFLKVIETKKAGGDISEILRENIQAIDQLSSFKNALESVDVEDKEKEKLAINIVAQNLQQKGLSNKVINAQLEDYIESGTLENEANTILDSHLQLHGQAIEQKKQTELQRAEKEKDDFKTFKKELVAKYKAESVPDNISKVLIENATKLDEYKISNTDKLYFEAQQKDPDLFMEVNYLLNNKEEYKKWVSSKKSLDAKKEIIKSSLVINTQRKKETNNRNSISLEDIATR